MIGGVLAGRRAKGRVEPTAELRPAMIERAEMARARVAALPKGFEPNPSNKPSRIFKPPAPRVGAEVTLRRR